MSGTAVIINGLRTPWAPAGGLLGGLSSADLAVAAIRELLEWTEIRTNKIDQFIFGTALSATDAPQLVQTIANRAHLGNSLPFYQIARHRGAGFQALFNACCQIESGQADAVIVAASASMSQLLEATPSPGVHPAFPHSANCIARKNSLNREMLDMFAANSGTAARHAQQKEALTEELCHLHLPPGYTVTVVADQLAPELPSVESLSRMPPLDEDAYGTATFGNVAQPADGAAALLLMSMEAAGKAGLQPVCAIRSMAICGSAGKEAGLAGAVAASRALTRGGITSRSLDLFEIDEQSAASALATIHAFESPGILSANPSQKASLSRLAKESINVNGGTIGWGDVPACSCLRQVVSLFKSLKRQNFQSGMSISNLDYGAAGAIFLELL